MRVLVACEYSGIVRDAFLRRGHDAMSCDVLETESPGPHYQGDVRDVLDGSWDIVIAHPPCTRLTKAGVRWLHERNLWAELDDACAFFRLFFGSAPMVAIENPQPHRYAVERIGRRHSQSIQPHQFGHPERKEICLWLEGLPPLMDTNNVYLEMDRLPKRLQHRTHYAAPGPDRAKERSRFFPGVADAMAEQWGFSND